MNRLANLLAMYTGMRASEVQALRVCDIFDNYIWISHAWDDKLGLKCPKNGEERPVPISADLRNALLTMASFNPRAAKDKDKAFVFYGITGEKPISQRGFNKYLHRALEYIDIQSLTKSASTAGVTDSVQKHELLFMMTE